MSVQLQYIRLQYIIILIMDINTRLQKLDPPLLDRLSKEELKAIADKHDYSIVVVRRMLRGLGKDLGYREDNIKAVVATAFQEMKSTQDAEKLELQFQKYIAA